MIDNAQSSDGLFVKGSFGNGGLFKRDCFFKMKSFGGGGAGGKDGYSTKQESILTIFL